MAMYVEAEAPAVMHITDARADCSFDGDVTLAGGRDILLIETAAGSALRICRKSRTVTELSYVDGVNSHLILV
jgi:hypothetical protein